MLAYIEYSVSGVGQKSRPITHYGLSGKDDKFMVLDEQNNLLKVFPDIDKSRSYIGQKLNEIVSFEIDGLRDLIKTNNGSWNDQYNGRRYNNF